MTARPLRLMISCEHAGNRIPAAYVSLFMGHQSILESHRGWDPGTLTLGREIARAFKAPIEIFMISRLLVEPNRSEHHPKLFSEFTRSLERQKKEAILNQWYRPHREALSNRIESIRKRGGRVLHVGVHSFTPELDGHRRNAEIGLLYDPSRPLERAFCEQWQRELRRVAPQWRVRRNYPYLGRADGLTTHLRTRFPTGDYLGIELELNQSLLGNRAQFPRAVREAVVTSLHGAMGPRAVEPSIRDRRP